MELSKIVGAICIFSLFMTMIPASKVNALDEIIESNKIKTGINISLSTHTLEIGSSLEVNGTITPSPSHNVNVTLTYFQPHREPINYTVLTSGFLTQQLFFTHIFNPTVMGQCYVMASWEGDDEFEGAASEVECVKVTQQTWIIITIFLAIGALFISLTAFVARPYAKRRFPLQR